VTRRDGRRPAAALAWLAAALLGLDLAWAALEASRPGLRDPEWAALMARLRLLRRRQPLGGTLTVILGSSRGQTGLRAAQLSGDGEGGSLVFNACVAGGGVLTQRVLLERLLAEGPGLRPDRLVLDVAPLFNCAAGAELEEICLEASRLSCAELRSVAASSVRPRRMAWSWLWARGLPLADGTGRLERLAPWLGRAPLHDRDSHGWKPRPTVPPACRQAYVGMTLHQYRRALAETRLSAAREAALLAVVRRCREEGIEAVLYLGPEHSRLRAAMTPELAADVERMLGEARRLGARVCDARAWLADEAFHDGHHPDTDGASALSERFAAEVLGGAR
jgi:hypothetical protein